MSVVHPTVTVRGRFVTNTGPLRGFITFTPQYLFLDPRADVLVAAMARSVELIEGTFSVELTSEMRYVVQAPMVGRFKIKPVGPGPVLMADLMPKKSKRK